MTTKCHYCKSTFTAKRSTAKFCSTSCRVNHSQGKTKRKPKAQPTVLCKLPSCNKLHSNKEYCSRDHQRAHTALLLPNRKWSNFKRSSLGLWFSSQIHPKRTGTVEALKGNTLESLHELKQVRALFHRANGTGTFASGDYAVVHLAAASTKRYIGLFHPCNVMVGDSRLNRSLSNKSFGHEYKILREDLDAKWFTIGLTLDGMLELANDYLDGLLYEFAQQLTVKPATKPKNGGFEGYILHSDVILDGSERLSNMSNDAHLTECITNSLKDFRTQLELDGLTEIDGDWFDDDGWSVEAPSDFDLICSGEMLGLDSHDLEYKILTRYCYPD